jgi:hypothetical protein
VSHPFKPQPQIFNGQVMTLAQLSDDRTRTCIDQTPCEAESGQFQRRFSARK